MTWDDIGDIGRIDTFPAGVQEVDICCFERNIDEVAAATCHCTLNDLKTKTLDEILREFGILTGGTVDPPPPEPTQGSGTACTVRVSHR